MERKILQNKLYLYLTEFFAGMSVMAVELGASRLLAPYFSSSQIVWTIIIGTIMIAMALGNLYGGRQADKNPDPDRLYLRIVIAAVWIGLIPVLGKYVILGVSALLILAVNSHFLVAAAFTACMVIFVFPLFLLGTVTPSLVKFSVDSLDDSGTVVGRLNASNTIGSIIGTFVPTFISIPVVGTSVTFLIFSGILLLLSVIYFVSSGVSFSRIKRLPAGLAVFALCCLLGRGNSFAFWQNDLTYEGESIYNYLQVRENEDQVILSTNVLFGVQSVYQKTEGPTGMYYDYAMAAIPMTGDGNAADRDGLDILILGNGSGTFATQCKRYYENVSITGVEIDQKITDLASEHFELPEDIEVVTYDGRAYLNAIDQDYDVIMVDAYQDITIPFQMSSVEYFRLVADHLKENGVMVVNMNMRSDSEGNINEYLADTIGQVFPEIQICNVTNWSNRMLFAGSSPRMAENLNARIAAEENADLKTMYSRTAGGLQSFQPGKRVMTDDKAPVELLGMRMIDEIISDELSYYKEIFKNEGVQGLMDSL